MNSPRPPREPSPACMRVRGRLERLMDGGLEPLATARDEGHIEACAGCAAEREQWEGFLGLLRRAERPAGTLGGELQAVERGVVERLEERVADEVRARRRALRGSLAVAAAALVCALGLFALAETTPGLPRSDEITRLELGLPQWGELLAELGFLGGQG